MMVGDFVSAVEGAVYRVNTPGLPFNVFDRLAAVRQRLRVDAKGFRTKPQKCSIKESA